jgi:Protein of unknown function (DUF3300)
MIMKTMKQTLSVVMCWALAAAGMSVEPAFASAGQSQAQEAGPTVAKQTAEELNALVAPIALYPDALVAQVLAAATVPDQVAIADYWLSEHQKLKGKGLEKAVNKESWDPSVKALTQFPSVLDDMAHNLAWTSNLGEAFHNQQADVMASVQTMRAKAQAAGTLKSTSQITVVQRTPETIVIQPASPQVVYVPQYNPMLVYGSPYVVPLYTPSVTVAAAAVSFGAGIAIGAAIGGSGGFIGGGFGWGFNSWNCNWGRGGGTVIYNHNTYINNTWNRGGNTYNGYHPWGPGPHGSPPYGPHPYPAGAGGYRPNGNWYRPDSNVGRAEARGWGGGAERSPGGFERSRSFAGDWGRSQMSRDGWGARAESNRGWSSMRAGGMGTPHFGGFRR